MYDIFVGIVMFLYEIGLAVLHIILNYTKYNFSAFIPELRFGINTPQTMR